MPTISNVSDDAPVEASWGNDVADTLNDECVKWDATDEWATSPDGSQMLSGDLPAIVVVRSSSLEIPDSSSTLLTWSAETYRKEFATITPDSSTGFTVPSGCGGLYLVSATARFAANTTGGRRMIVNISSNGSITAPPIGQNVWPGSSLSTDLACSQVVRLQAAAVVSVSVFQSSTAGLNVESAGLSIVMLRHLV